MRISAFTKDIDVFAVTIEQGRDLTSKMSYLGFSLDGGKRIFLGNSFLGVPEGVRKDLCKKLYDGRESPEDKSEEKGTQLDE